MDLSALLRDREYEKPTQCTKCGGNLKYTGVGEYVCEVCRNIEYDDYGKVRNFIENHPGANIKQTEKGTGVSKAVIHGLIESGKLEVSSKTGFLRGDGEE